MKQWYQENIKPSRETVRRQIGQVVELSGGFKCNVCMNLVSKPQLCVQCDKIFCSFCTDQWVAVKQFSECPLCKSREGFREPGRLVMDLLNCARLAGCSCVQCDQNGEEMSYAGFLQHLEKDCQWISVVCPVGCGEEFPRSNWEEHFESKCTGSIVPETLLSTEKRKNKILRRHTDEMRKTIDDLQLEIAYLRDEIERLRQTRSPTTTRNPSSETQSLHDTLTRALEIAEQRLSRPRVSQTFERNVSFCYRNGNYHCVSHGVIVPIHQDTREAKCDCCQQDIPSLSQRLYCAQCPSPGLHVCLSCVSDPATYQQL